MIVIKNNLQVMALILTILLCGCATRRSFLDANINPTSEYKYHQEQDGLSVAIDPFFDSEKIVEYFGINLLDQGYLPVHVVVENHNAKSAFLLEKQNFSIMTIEQQNDKSESSPTYREPMQSYSSNDIYNAETSGKIAFWAPLFPILIIPASFGLPSEYRIRNISIVNENMRKKTFVDKTLFSNENHSGFIYFQINNQTSLKNISVISVKTTKIISDEVLNFNFTLK
jgi:hypothetical protein